MQHRIKKNQDEPYKEVRKKISEKDWAFEVMKPVGKMFRDIE